MTDPPVIPPETSKTLWKILAHFIERKTRSIRYTLAFNVSAPLVGFFFGPRAELMYVLSDALNKFVWCECKGKFTQKKLTVEIYDLLKERFRITKQLRKYAKAISISKCKDR